MAENIREEIRRLNRRKQLQFSSSALEKMQQDSESSGSEMGAESPRRPDSPPSLLKNPETALFTFKQVRIFIFCQLHLFADWSLFFQCDLIFPYSVISLLIAIYTYGILLHYYVAFFFCLILSCVWFFIFDQFGFSLIRSE